MKIIKQDNVLIIKGKDRGKSGKVERVLPEVGKIVVTGINLAKRHEKPRSKAKPGGVTLFPAPFRADNVMLICPSCDASTRVGYKRLEGGKRVRVCRKCQNTIAGIKK